MDWQFQVIRVTNFPVNPADHLFDSFEKATLAVDSLAVMREVDIEHQFACLAYHAIEHGQAAQRYIVGEQDLGVQLRFLKSENYVVEGFEQLESRLRSREPFPQRYVVFTVDDGETSSLRAADMLEEFRANATFFLTRDRSTRAPGYLRIAEIRELRRRGFSLGTHGTTHRGLAFLPEALCVTELRDSKRWLEDLLGEAVLYMSFPGGYVNRRTVELAKNLGYRLVGNSKERMNSPAALSLHGQVNRIAVRRNFSPRDFQRIVEGDRGFYLWRQARLVALAIPKTILQDQA
ncbi:MAG TPA: polysaccharide deacetylase family protein [Terriglobia bacterium]|nr:polysaccharide deacetylase family protein [Terriglobia bacterium]